MSFHQVQRKRCSIYRELVETLIHESIGEFKLNGSIGLHILPKSIRDVLNSLACHGNLWKSFFLGKNSSFHFVGAIRFGDELSMNQSIQLIRALGKCDVPFQCAHGRPLLVPLLELDNLVHLTMENIQRPNFAQLNALDI